MKNDKAKCLNMIKDMILVYTYPTKKGGSFKQLYTVDFSQPCKIGGTSEEGYMLSWYPEKKETNIAITYLDLLRLLHSDSPIKRDYCTIQKIMQKPKHYFKPSEADTDTCEVCESNFRSSEHITL